MLAQEGLRGLKWLSSDLCEPAIDEEFNARHIAAVVRGEKDATLQSLKNYV
jgi:hypothetical protein